MSVDVVVDSVDVISQVLSYDYHINSAVFQQIEESCIYSGVILSQHSLIESFIVNTALDLLRNLGNRLYDVFLPGDCLVVNYEGSSLLLWTSLKSAFVAE